MIAQRTDPHGLRHARPRDGNPAMPVISVIVPAWRPSNFAFLQESLASNTEVDAEWIVVDDGSGPAFDAVFASLPAAVRVIREAENRRQGAARNIGLAAARGDWIKFLDADDRLNAGHLATLLAATRSLDAKAIPFARTRHFFFGGEQSVNTSGDDLPADPDAQFTRQLIRPFLSHCGALFPRALLLALGGYDETLVTDEDGDLLLRTLQAGYHFAPVDGVYYDYIHHAGAYRVSADNDRRKLEARVRTCEKVEACFAAGMPPQVACALAQRMDKIAMSFWTVFPAEAHALVARARTLSPGYSPDMRAPLRLLRRLGGPRLVIAASRLYRQLRRRTKGGTRW